MSVVTNPVRGTAVRGPALRRVIRAVEDDARLPWDAELAAAFGDRDTLLLALHGHWSRQLLSRIDVALELGSGTPRESVALAWRSAVRDQPGVHRVLVAAADSAALRPAHRSLYAAVAVAAGLATFDTPVATSVATAERFLAQVLATTPAPRRRSRLTRVLRRIWDGGPPADPWPWAA